MKYTLTLLAALLFAHQATLQAADIQPSIPQTVDELWKGFAELDKNTPLETEVLKEWEQDGVACRIVRYQVGVFKGAPSKVAAFYAFPKGGAKLPALVEMHGGGQSASLNSVVTYAKRGYASISINWGGNKMSMGSAIWSGPQTDWGKLDATHPPQRNKANHFAGSLTPDEYTLDTVESPRNSNWFLVLMAARRAITFLDQQPEVDATRIGAHGHSMGGKLTTNLAGIDKRIKAAVPSCGGSGDLLESQTDLPGGSRTKRTPLELACISDNAYLPLITCPILWLSPTNDFHAHIDNMAWNWRELPNDRVRFSISPHLNHHHTEAHSITEYLWFEEHLKGAPFKMPQTPQIAIELKTSSGVPRITVTPDDSQPVRRVDVYYSIDPHALTRFWRDALPKNVGKQWQAECPVMNLDQPLFVFANVVYETPEQYRTGPHKAGQEDGNSFAISSRVLSAGPAHLQAAKVKATDQPDRLIDDGARGWHDWYLLNWGHPPLWTATTRKLKDPKWRGPDGATLHFEVQCESDNQLVLTFNCNAWGAMIPGKPAVDYTVVKKLNASKDRQTISVKLSELVATDPKINAPLADWQTVTEFSISPSGTTIKDGQKVKADGKAWQGPREIHNLRWEGGEYSRPAATSATLNPEDFQKNFNDAIKKSLEQEKLNGAEAEEPASPRATTTVPLWPKEQMPGRGSTGPEREMPAKGDNVIRLTDINEPAITVFKVPDTNKPTPAVIICPGGAYNILAYNKEGTEIAVWLNSIGITAVVLKYRVPGNQDGAFQDIQRAVRLVRRNASDWNISPNRVGVMGFSAGGHLCAKLSTNEDKSSYPKLDVVDEEKLRPDFAILIYPAYLSRINGKLAGDLPVSANTPPTFMVHTEDDKSFVAGSKIYHESLQAAKVMNEFFLCATGGHGYGLRSDKEVRVWPQKCQAWLIKAGIL